MELRVKRPESSYEILRMTRVRRSYDSRATGAKRSGVRQVPGSVKRAQRPGHRSGLRTCSGRQEKPFAASGEPEEPR